MNNPISVQDTNFYVIAMESSKKYVNDSLWENMKKTGHWAQKDIMNLRDTKLLFPNDSTIWNSDSLDHNTRMIKAIYSPAGKLIGTVMLFQVYKLFSNEDHNLLNEIASALSVLIPDEDAHAVSASKEHLLISDLLNDVYMNESIFHERLAETCFVPMTYFIIGYIQSTKQTGIYYQIDYIRTILQQSFTEIFPVKNGNDLFVLFCFNSLAQKIHLHEALSDFLNEQNLEMGFSNYFSSLATLKIHADHAAAALKLGRKYLEGPFYSYNEILIYDILENCETSILRIAYEDSAFNAMLQYDKEKGVSVGRN